MSFQGTHNFILGAALLGSIGLNLLFKGRHKPKCDTINVESTVVDEDCVKYQTTFGGMELYIPKTWQVVNHTSAAFGGIHEKNHPHASGKPTLVLEGSISFGGVEIFYV